MNKLFNHENQIFYFVESAVNLEDLKIKIDNKIVQLESGLFQCTDCSYISKFRHNLPKHIEAKHIGKISFNFPLILVQLQG